MIDWSQLIYNMLRASSLIILEPDHFNADSVNIRAKPSSINLYEVRILHDMFTTKEASYMNSLTLRIMFAWICCIWKSQKTWRGIFCLDCINLAKNENIVYQNKNFKCCMVWNCKLWWNDHGRPFVIETGLEVVCQPHSQNLPIWGLSDSNNLTVPSDLRMCTVLIPIWWGSELVLSFKRYHLFSR